MDTPPSVLRRDVGVRDRRPLSEELLPNRSLVPEEVEEVVLRLPHPSRNL